MTGRVMQVRRACPPDTGAVWAVLADGWRLAALGARHVETLRRLASLAERPRRELHSTQG
jgi:hypothetical protein